MARRKASALRQAPPKSAAGFGMLEILITLLLLAAGLVALSKLQGGLVAGGSAASQQSEAGFIGQRVIEDLRGRNWSSTDLSAGLHNLPGVAGRSAAYAVSYEVLDNLAPPYKTVVSTVNWTDTQGALQASRITSRFQKAGADGSLRVLQSAGAGGSATSSSAQGSRSSESSLQAGSS